jgi:hypothetical protein
MVTPTTRDDLRARVVAFHSRRPNATFGEAVELIDALDAENQRLADAQIALVAENRRLDGVHQSQINAIRTALGAADGETTVMAAEKIHAAYRAGLEACETLRRERRSLEDHLDRAEWNLAGCATLAETRSMANFDEAQVSPALRAVRGLLQDHLALRAEATKLREAIVGMAREVVDHLKSIRQATGAPPLNLEDSVRWLADRAKGLADVARELTAAGVPENPDVGSRVRYLAQKSVDAPGLRPMPAAPGSLHLFAAMIPGEWSSKADEWFVYRRVGTTPWVDVSWRHGPGVANSTVDAGPTCAAPTCSASIEAGPNFGGTTPNFGGTPRAPYNRNAVADRIESVARGLTYNETKEEGRAKHWLYELASRVRRGATTEPHLRQQDVQDDLAAILRALGLGDHARATSCHEIVQGEILPAIGRLTESVEKSAQAANEWGRVVGRAGSALDALGVAPGDSVVSRIEGLAALTKGHSFPLGTRTFAQQVAHLARLAQGEHVQRSTVNAVLDAIGVPTTHYGRDTARLEDLLRDDVLPRLRSIAELVERARRVYVGGNEMPLASAVQVLTQRAGQAFEAEKELAAVRKAISDRMFPPCGGKTGHALADEIWAIVDFAREKANEAHRLGADRKELAEIRDLLDRGGWPNMQGNPERKLRLAERVAEVASRARVFAEAEQMSRERAQRAEAQLREVAKRVAGWVPASDGAVGRDTCSAGPT